MADNSLTAKTFRGLLWMGSSTICNALLQIVFVFIMARLIPPHDYGIMATALIVVSFSQVFTQFGVGQALVQFSDLTEHHIRTAFSFNIFMGLTVYGVVVALAPLLARFFSMPELAHVLTWLGLIFVIKSLALTAEALIIRRMQFKKLAVRDAVSHAVAYGGVGLPLAFGGYGVWALVGANLAQETIRAIALSIMSPHPRKPEFHGESLRSLLTYGGGASLSGILNKFALQGDNIIIGRFLGTEALGFYNRAYQLMAMPVNLAGFAFQQVLFPAFASVQDEQERIGRAYLKALTLMLYVLLPLTAFAYVLAPHIVAVLLGPTWQGAVAAFQVLSLGLYFRLGYKINGALLKAVGKVYRHALLQGIYALAVVVGALLGKRHGIEGVAIGVLGALSLHYLLMSSMGIRASGLKYRTFIWLHLKALVLSLVIGLVLSVVEHQALVYKVNSLATLLCSLGIVSLVLAFLLFDEIKRLLDTQVKF